MSIVVDGERSSMDRRASAFLKRTLSGSLRDADPSPMALLILAGVPVAAAAWAMMSPEQLLSNAMTWDLLFNLAGAWHLHLGHVPHVDFHEPVGALNFVLTAIGFRLVGVGPLAFLTGAALMTSVLFVAAFFAVLRRLPLAPAAMFVTFVCLLALMPANLGERPDQYTMAMSYNRYCWGAFAILALILFVPPRNDRGHDGVDIALAALLLLAMFYLKITYFAAGLATVALAIVLQPHVGRRWPAWAAVCALVITNALAPHSHPYLTDILGSASSGALRDNAMMHAKNFFAAAGEYAPYLAAMIVACWLWWTGRATPRLVLSLGLLFAVALFLLTQNTQAAGLPSAIVIILVLYDQLRVRFAGVDDRELTPLLAALLVFPAFALATSAMTITGYHVKVNRTPALHVMESTQLRGLAVPAGQLGAFVNFSRGRIDQPLPNEAGMLMPRYEISQHEYVTTLLEAADLLADRPPGGIAVFDQVDPMAFALGLPPVRGANLWSYWDSPRRPAEEYLGPVTYVLIPKFSSDPNWTAALAGHYSGYLAANFQRAVDSPSWIVMVRNRAESPSDRAPAPERVVPLAGRVPDPSETIATKPQSLESSLATTY